MTNLNKKQKATIASVAFAAVCFLGIVLGTDPEKEVRVSQKTAKAVEVDEDGKALTENSEEIQVSEEPKEGEQAVLVDGGSSSKKEPTAKQSSKPAAVGSGKQANRSEQATAEKQSSDGAGQKGMSYTQSQQSGTPQTAPSSTPEVVEVKPVETPVSTPAPSTPAPTPEAPVVVPEPTVVLEPTPAPVPSTPAPQEPVVEGPSLDYSGATQEEVLIESQACPVGYFWDGTGCVYN